MSNLPQPPQDDDELRVKKLERFILAGAIVGPMIIGLWSVYRRSGPVNPSVFGSLFTYVRTYTEGIVMLGLMIWLAWRYPTLGGRAVRSILIVLAVLSALLIADYAMTSWLFETSDSVMRIFLLIYRPISLLMSVVALVLARRVFKIVLVKRREPQDYRPARLSIRELMIWTLVIAGFLALHQQLTRWTSQSSSVIDTPFWFMIYSTLAHYVPTALLVVVIVRFQRIAFWKWFPVVTIVYTLWTVADGQIQIAVYNSQLGLGIPGPSMTFRITTAVLTTLMTVFVVWLFQKLGYRFLQATSSAPAFVNSEVPELD